MNTLDSFAAAGYAAFPAIGGRPIVGGILNQWRYTRGMSERFPADCDVGLICAARPVPNSSLQTMTPSGVATKGAGGFSPLSDASTTWIAAIRWTIQHPVMRKEIDTLVNAALGDGPTYVDGNTVTRLARVDQPFSTRQLPPLHFSGEDWKSLTYRPHRFELMCRGSWVILSRNAKPTPRAELPAIDGERAERLISSVETAFYNRGALPWV